MTLQQAGRCVQDREKWMGYLEGECPPSTTTRKSPSLSSNLVPCLSFKEVLQRRVVCRTAYDELGSSTMVDI